MGPLAQTGLRSGKLARIVPEALPGCRTIDLFISRSAGYSQSSMRMKGPSRHGTLLEFPEHAERRHERQPVAEVAVDDDAAAILGFELVVDAAWIATVERVRDLGEDVE